MCTVGYEEIRMWPALTLSHAFAEATIGRGQHSVGRDSAAVVLPHFAQRLQYNDGTYKQLSEREGLRHCLSPKWHVG